MKSVASALAFLLALILVGAAIANHDVFKSLMLVAAAALVVLHAPFWKEPK